MCLCAHWCTAKLKATAVHSELPEQVWCVSEWRIRGHVESATAAALPPEPARHRAGHRGDREILPSPVIAPSLFPSCLCPLLLSSMFPPPSPPSLGSLHPSALWLPGGGGRCDGGVLGHLVMPLPLLDTDTSISRNKEGMRKKGKHRRRNDVKGKEDEAGSRKKGEEETLV